MLTTTAYQAQSPPYSQCAFHFTVLTCPVGTVYMFCKGGAPVLISLTQARLTALLTLLCSAPQNADPPEPSSESVRPRKHLEEHLLCVKKTSVGRAHSLPNDSYMFLPHQPRPFSTTLITSAQQTQSGAARAQLAHDNSII